MRKSPRFEEMDIISEMRKHCSKCLTRDIKHEQLLGKQPNFFFSFHS